MDDQWFTAAIEEYRSLRSEAVKAREAQLRVLQLGVALIAALVGLGVGLRSEKVLAGLFLSVVVPVMVGLTFELWIGEIRRTVRAGAFVAAIEKRLALCFSDHALGPPMGWETWLRRKARRQTSWPGGERIAHSQQEHDSLILALVISGFLLVVGIGSFATGLHFLWDAREKSLTYAVAAASGLLFIALFIRAYFAVHGIRLRDEAPLPQEVWHLRKKELRSYKKAARKLKALQKLEDLEEGAER